MGIGCSTGCITGVHDGVDRGVDRRRSLRTPRPERAHADTRQHDGELRVEPLRTLPRPFMLGVGRAPSFASRYISR